MFSFIRDHWEICKLRQQEFDRKYMKCPKCHGRAYTETSYGMDNYINSCSTCFAKGYVLREEYRRTCMSCCGKGYIDSQTKPEMR
jgi:DnaJ-class molecular chaperone